MARHPFDCQGEGGNLQKMLDLGMRPDILDPSTNETPLEQVFKSVAINQFQANAILKRFKNNKTKQVDAVDLLRKLGDTLEINGERYFSDCALKIIADRLSQRCLYIYSLPLKKLKDFNTLFN